MITNIGNHYDASTGKFHCKYAGVYIFSLSLYKKSTADSAQCWIRKNGSNVLYAYSDPNLNADRGFYEASNFVVLHLNISDVVDVGGCTKIDTMAYETSFSGFLLKAD